MTGSRKDVVESIAKKVYNGTVECNPHLPRLGGQSEMVAEQCARDGFRAGVAFSVQILLGTAENAGPFSATWAVTERLAAYLNEYVDVEGEGNGLEDAREAVRRGFRGWRHDA